MVCPQKNSAISSMGTATVISWINKIFGNAIPGQAMNLFSDAPLVYISVVSDRI